MGCTIAMEWNMKKNEIIFVIVLFVGVAALMLAPVFSKSAHEAVLRFDFTRQDGSSSNQYAIWIEDSEGDVVKPIFITYFSANGGWEDRPLSLPLWAEKIGQYSNGNVDVVSTPTLSKYKANDGTIDVMAGSTPKTGPLSYSWTLTDMKGQRLKDGEYTFVLEATLRSENRVVHKIGVDLKSGEIIPLQSEYFGASDTEHAMIQDVKLVY